MELDLAKLKKDLIEFNETGKFTEYIGTTVMYLAHIQTKKYRFSKYNDRLISEDLESMVIEDVLSRLLHTRARNKFKFDKADKQLLVFIKNMVKYSILNVRRKIFRANSRENYDELGSIVELTDEIIDKLYFEPVFPHALDIKVNGSYPLWVGLYG